MAYHPNGHTDPSPEVEFGAFFRPTSRPAPAGQYGLPASSSSSSPGAATSNGGTIPGSSSPLHGPASSSAAPSSSSSRVRGAPRLGGLGLGGIGANTNRPSNGPLVAKSLPINSERAKAQQPALSSTSTSASSSSASPAANASSLSSAAATTNGGSDRNNRTPSYAQNNTFPSIKRRDSSPKRPAYTVTTSARPNQVSLDASTPHLRTSSPTSFVQSAPSSTTERPFLSPEMVKPNARSKAFALDRPTPDSGLPHAPTADDSSEEDLPSAVEGHDESPRTDDLSSFVTQLESPDTSRDGGGFSHLSKALSTAPLSKSIPASTAIESSSPLVQDDDASDYEDNQESASSYQGTPSGLIAAAFAPLDPKVRNHLPSTPPAVVTSIDSPRSSYTESELAGHSAALHGYDEHRVSTGSTSDDLPLTPESVSDVVFAGDESSYVEPDTRETYMGKQDSDLRRTIKHGDASTAPMRSATPDDSDVPPQSGEFTSSTSRTLSRKTSNKSLRKKAEAPPRPKRLRVPGAKSPRLDASPALSDGSFADLSPATSRDDGSPARPVQVPLVVPGPEPKLEEAASAPGPGEVRPTLSQTSSGHSTLTGVPTTTSPAPESPSTEASSYSYAGLGLRMPSSLSRASRRQSMNLNQYASSATMGSSLTSSAPAVDRSVERAEHVLASAPASAPAPALAPVVKLTAASDLKREMEAKREAERERKRQEEEEQAAVAAAAVATARAGTSTSSSEEEEDESDADSEKFATPRPSLSYDSARPPDISLIEPTPVKPTKSTRAATLPTANNSEPDAGGTSSAAEIGVAAVGAIVTGGMAVGYTAWRGLGAVASWGWGSGNAKALAVKEEEENDSGNETEADMGLPGAFGSKAGRERRASSSTHDSDKTEGEGVVAEEEKTGAAERRRQRLLAEQQEAEGGAAEEGSSDIISTEWGDIHFPAPEGFLEEFKKAMAELGPEDLAANDQTELDAQQAAYAAATALHNDAEANDGSEEESPDGGSASLSPPPPRMTFPTKRRKNRNRESIMSVESQRTIRHDAIEEDDDEGTEREFDEFDELVDIIAPMYNDDRNPESRSRYRSPPGLVGSPRLGRTASMVSNSSATSTNFTPSIMSSTDSIKSDSGRSSGGGLFSFGRNKRKSVLRTSSFQSVDSDSASRMLIPSSSSSQSISSGSGGSADRPRSIMSETSSIGGDSPGLGAKIKRRSSLFSTRSGKSGSSSVESSIADTTYVSYSTGRAAARRNSRSGSDSLSPPDREASLPLSEGGDSLRSSLRAEPRFGRGGEDAQPTSPSEKKIYRVRFANATRGIGLRSVAESEAVKGGDETHALKWVGVGRGRYGNLVLMADEQSDEVYAEQVAQIKKNRRFGPGAAGLRDWSTVKVD